MDKPKRYSLVQLTRDPKQAAASQHHQVLRHGKQ